MKGSFLHLKQCRVVHPVAGPIGVILLPIEYHDEQLLITPQAKIGEYSVDFLLSWKSREIVPRSETRLDLKEVSINVVVECDGHEFHEKTKQQASADKKRDRMLQKLGYKVFRYSGSDVFSNPEICANEVIQFVKSNAEAQQDDVFKQALDTLYPEDIDELSK
jgi:very-short-patch-repair endonuclease